MDDPIAFFDDLAAKSATPQSSFGETCSNESEQLHSLETFKMSNAQQQQQQQQQQPVPEVENPIDNNTLKTRWDHFIGTYKIHKEELRRQLDYQLRLLRELDEKVDKSNIELHTNIETAYQQLNGAVSNYEQHLNTEKEQFDREKQLIKAVRRFQDEKVKLNVGGQVFETSLTTLRKDPNSMLASMFSESNTLVPDADNSYFIDRDSTYFRLVLNYLRDSRIPSGIVDDPKIMDELMQEARFYKLNGLLKLRWNNLPIISQEELLKMYPLPNNNNTNKYVIMRLEKKDLSNLDFSNYHIDPRSSFADSNLENASFENSWFGFDFDHQTDFSYTFLVGTKFPEQGTNYRASGVEFKLEGAIESL